MVMENNSPNLGSSNSYDPNFFQNQANQPPVQSNLTAQPAQPEITPTAPYFEPIDASKWSWGGFMNPWTTPLAAKKFAYLGMFLLYLIPFLGIFIVHIFFGLKARYILQNHNNAFANNTELAGFIRGYDRAGKYFFFIITGFFVLGILLAFMGAMPFIQDLMSFSEEYETESSYEEMEFNEEFNF